MKLIQELLEAETSRRPAKDVFDLINTVELGKFKFDGSHLTPPRFICAAKQLRSLSGCPAVILGNFDCSDNHLTTLKGGPTQVDGDYLCGYNRPLTNFIGMPKRIGGQLNAKSCNIKSLDGIAQEIGGIVTLYNNSLVDLHDIHRRITKMNGMLQLRENTILGNMAGIMMIEGCTHISLSFNNTIIEKIFNTHLKKPFGKARLRECQSELVDAGFEEYAKL